MNTPHFSSSQFTSFRGVRISLVFLLTGLLCASCGAQSGDELQAEYPQLAELYNAFDVTHAALLDAMAEINADPATQETRNQLHMQLSAKANMSMAEYMRASTAHGDMSNDGPYSELEGAARRELNDLVRGRHSDVDAASAYMQSAALTARAAEVIQYGRDFESRVWSIFADPSASIESKRETVDAAIQAYLADNLNSVSALPKSAALWLAHDYVDAFRSAFPKLSGLSWANQWLQLASLEAIILGQVDSQFANSVDITLDRYWKKVGSDTGMSMFPAPSEMPSVPAIAPQLYSQSPQAAIIIDNLNTLEFVIADIIAYPNLENRDAAIDVAVAEFTNKESNIVASIEYLSAVLRGGIYNQGGPAIGELTVSERNRSRSAMDMQHNMTMSAPN